MRDVDSKRKTRGSSDDDYDDDGVDDAGVDERDRAESEEELGPGIKLVGLDSSFCGGFAGLGLIGLVWFGMGLLMLGTWFYFTFGCWLVVE